MTEENVDTRSLRLAVLYLLSKSVMSSRTMPPAALSKSHIDCFAADQRLVKELRPQLIQAPGGDDRRRTQVRIEWALFQNSGRGVTAPYPADVMPCG